MSDPLVTAALYAAAAVAKVLATNYEQGKLWEGELEKKIGDITEYLRAAQSRGASK